VIITLDNDFTTLLALRQSVSPSVVFIRQVGTKPWEVHLQPLLDNLGNLVEDLLAGAVVSLSPTARLDQTASDHVGQLADRLAQ
jgi:hypothetical protein